MLKYSPANAKLKRLGATMGLPKGKKVFSFDLLSGYSCPHARLCMSKAVETPDGLRVKDGPHTKFRCFSASQEAIYKNTYKLRKANFEAIKAAKTTPRILELLESSLPKNAGIIRFHVAGDFFSYSYFLAVVELAKRNPSIVFYTYTKAVPFVEKFGVENLPTNLRINLSMGGRHDSKVQDIGLPVARVVFSESEAERHGWEIDHTDEHAARENRRDFSILIHSIQPANTEASRAVATMRKNKVNFSYRK